MIFAIIILTIVLSVLIGYIYVLEKKVKNLILFQEEQFKLNNILIKTIDKLMVDKKSISLPMIVGEC